MNKLVDTRNISKLNVQFDDYDSLISYYQSIPIDFFKENNIYYEIHHIIPRNNGGLDTESNLVPLDFYHHILAHYLYGKKFLDIDKTIAYKNFL